MQKITKSACHQMPRNRDKMPHADAETQATYLDAKGAYTVRQTCTKMLKFTMYRVRTILVLGYRVLADTGQYWGRSGIGRYFFDCETGCTDVRLPCCDQ